MQNNRILLFGRSGQVGWELRRTLCGLGDVVAVGYPDVDFTCPETLRNALRHHDPAVVINAAAYTAVDKAEEEPERAMAVNGTAPAVMAEEAAQSGRLLIHYSTDYVFDGSGTRPWQEGDASGPLNVYGKTKLAGDEAIMDSGCEHLIFRTSWVYGARGGNFMLTMLRLAKERNQISIVDDQMGAPTTSECIAQATSNVLAQVLAPSGKGMNGRSGVYNLTNAGETSWYGFARELLTRANATMGTPLPELVPIPTSQFPRPARRPMNSRLDGEKLRATFGVRLPAWQDGLGLICDRLACA